MNIGQAGRAAFTHRRNKARSASARSGLLRDLRIIRQARPQHCDDGVAVGGTIGGGNVLFSPISAVQLVYGTASNTRIDAGGEQLVHGVAIDAIVSGEEVERGESCGLVKVTKKSNSPIKNG